MWGGGRGLAWGYPNPNPSHHILREHDTTEPREGSSGVGGMALEMPCPCCLGCSRSQRGQEPPALAAAPPKCCLDESLQRRQPSPRRGVPSTPLSSKSPQRGRKPPVCPGVSQDPNLAQLWGREDPLWLLQGPQMSTGQAGIWGCWGWVWKAQEPGSRICTNSPQRRGRNGATLQPWGCKMPPHPPTEPPPIPEPPPPHTGACFGFRTESIP